MDGVKEGTLGTKANPVDNSVQGQQKLKAKESSTSQQPGSVQRTTMGQTAEENHNGRQEPDADGSTSLADSYETTEAIRRSPRAESRRGQTAVGKSGQGAMKDRTDALPNKKPDSYADISPGKQNSVEKSAAELGQVSKAAGEADPKTNLEQNFSHFESNNGNF